MTSSDSDVFSLAPPSISEFWWDDVQIPQGTSSIRCVWCHSVTHIVFRCPNVGRLSPDQLLRRCQEERRCFNCFGNHSRRYCRSTKNCRVCNASHHSMLHGATPHSAPQPDSTSQLGQDAAPDPTVVPRNQPLSCDPAPASALCPDCDIDAYVWDQSPRARGNAIATIARWNRTPDFPPVHAFNRPLFPRAFVTLRVHSLREC